MNVNKQFINIAGILLVVVVLTAGIALIALPMFSQAQATQAQTATVEQTNSVYQAQIDALSADEARSDEIDASLAALRTEIAATPQLDDVFEIVATAAEANQATIESVVAAEPTAFAARPPVVDAGGLGRPVAAPEESAEQAETTGETDAESSTDAAADAAAAPTPSDTDSLGPQQEVMVTIVVTVPDANTAAAFIDALRVGPRLILPTDNALADGKLTVKALAFIRTED